jgi:hypothetical protein
MTQNAGNDQLNEEYLFALVLERKCNDDDDDDDDDSGDCDCDCEERISCTYTSKFFGP